jgi:hypothetical protein
MFHQHYQTDCHYRTQDIHGPLSSYCEFIPAKKEEPKDVMAQFVDDRGEMDPVMQEKLDIISSRPVKGSGKVKHVKHVKHSIGEKAEKPKPIPGLKLMKKLHKQNQLEKSLERVIKNLI